MGYRISYENGLEKTPLRSRERSKKLAILKWCPFVIAAGFLIACIFSYRFRQLLLPGNKAVTEAAITELVDSVREGEEFGEAITTFCRQIIKNSSYHETASFD